MSYSWIGAPAEFNGTNEVTGGDSGELRVAEPPMARPSGDPLHGILTVILYSHREPQPMVPIRRPGLHPHFFGHGVAHGPRHRLPLLRSRPQKVGPVAHLGGHDVLQCHRLPMVLLGLLLGSQQHGDQRLHRQPRPLRSPQHPRSTIARLPPDSRASLLFLPGRTLLQTVLRLAAC